MAKATALAVIQGAANSPNTSFIGSGSYRRIPYKRQMLRHAKGVAAVLANFAHIPNTHSMKTTAIVSSLMLSAAAMAQTGGITPAMLETISKAAPGGRADKAIANAIANNPIDNLAKSASALSQLDTKFSVETRKQSIHDQKSSGRCWMFSGFNVLRSDFAMAADSAEVEFSHAYLFFYDQLEKANLMLQATIDNAGKPMDDPLVRFFFKNPVGDGGTFCGVVDLAAKYGLVPKEAQPETYTAENTSRLGRLLSSKLREFGLELRAMAADGKKPAAMEKRKTEMLSTIYRMLSLTLGEPVKKFTYAFKDKDGNRIGVAKEYTPAEFCKATSGGLLPDGYIMVMNDPRRPYHKTYEVAYDRHTYDGHNWKYLNLPMDEIAQLAIASLKAGHKMYSSYDVGKQLDRDRGYLDLRNYDYGSLFGTDFGMDKAQRISTFDSGSTHAMTLTAVDLDEEGKPVKWKVENSWGKPKGQDGYLVMTNEWFNEYMFRLVVDKRFVPKETAEAFAQKPEMLTYDDPLFGADD